MRLSALLGFAPFIAFLLIENSFGTLPGLVAGFVVSLGLIARDVLSHRGGNILEIGSAMIFGGLAVLAMYRDHAWSVWQVRLYVDAGLAVVVCLGLLLRRPFTMQHSAQAVAARPEAVRHNAVLSGAWAASFAALAVVDLYMTLHPGARDRLGIILSLTILGAAARFTHVYVKHIRMPPAGQ